MAQFYKELKDLRLTQGIDLGELEKRTKINKKYLKAIEVGNFDITGTLSKIVFKSIF